LASGYSVCVVDDLSTGSAGNIPPGPQFQRVDICDLVALRDVVARFRPEIVFHAAAQTDVRRSVREPDFDARVNVLGGLNVLRAGIAGGARRMIYASSAAVYGNPAQVPVSEAAPTRPTSEYGASKLAFEHYLSAYAARGLIEYSVLRYANVYGPRQRSDGEAGVVSIFTRQMLAGEPVTIRAAAGPSGVVANVGWGRKCQTSRCSVRWRSPRNTRMSRSSSRTDPVISRGAVWIPRSRGERGTGVHPCRSRTGCAGSWSTRGLERTRTRHPRGGIGEPLRRAEAPGGRSSRCARR